MYKIKRFNVLNEKEFSSLSEARGKIEEYEKIIVTHFCLFLNLNELNIQGSNMIIGRMK